MNLRDMRLIIRIPWEYPPNDLYWSLSLPLSLNTSRCPIDVCMRGVSSPVASYLASPLGGKVI